MFFVDAVRHKYKYVKEEAAESGELVGGEKTGKKQALDLLQRVFLPRAAVSSAGAEGEIRSTCGAIEELDLEENPLDWDVVLAIGGELPHLRWLGLNHVQLTPRPSLGSALTQLHTLCVSGTGMAWTQLLVIARDLPFLEELHFSSNGVRSLQSVEEAEEAAPAAAPAATPTAAPAAALPAAPPLPLQKLRLLFLEDNEIDSWESLAPLATLSTLETLNLNCNRLSSIPEIVGFRSLRHIMLRANPISRWESIDHLDGVPSLREARLAELELTSSLSGAVSRRLFIARIAKLEALNGSEVRPRERDDAERFYVRQLTERYPEGGLPDGALRECREGETPTLQLPQSDAWDAFHLDNPRWRDLFLKHGEQRSGSGGADAGGATLAAELIELNMRATAAEAAAIPMQTRRLPSGLPLKSLKLIACQLFKIEPAEQQLLYSPPGMDKEIPEPLDDELQRLCDFGVVSGGTIVVENK